ncbi:MAG: hypothetical protein IBJ12_11950 [Sphingomonadaceae bacterium]|nr:hypothetical protein [Sphingomonadaceae bacterium]
MKTLTKSLLGAGAAAAALVSVSAPAQARDRYDRDRDGISAGEVIAGAVVLGGLAAVIAASDDDRDYRYGYDRSRYDYDRAGYGYNYRHGGSRAAVNQCVNSVERWAGRYSRSDVTQIRDIERTRYGYRVKGNVIVRDDWRGRNSAYDRYDRYDRGYDRGRFTCYVERGRVVDIDYSGLDRWR